MVCLLQKACKVVNHFSDNLMIEKRLLFFTYKTSVCTVETFSCWNRGDVWYWAADKAYFIGCCRLVQFVGMQTIALLVYDPCTLNT